MAVDVNDLPMRLAGSPNGYPAQSHTLSFAEARRLHRDFEKHLAQSVPQRVQRSRAKGWQNPEHTIYVGRPTIFGNPFVTGPGRDAVKLYRQWLDGVWSPSELLVILGWERRKRSEQFNLLDQLHAQRLRVLKQLPHLRGWNLSCWCALESPCHASVLLELANK
jgi:hypothetical protein